MFPNAPMLLPDLLKTTRQFFWNLNFSEVEVPYLNSTLPLEQNIYTFSTLWTRSQAKYYLPTSPEFALKKHLATTQKDCFAISHCFRDLESAGPHHTPEFLMLEYYLVNKNLSKLIDFTKNYISQFGNWQFENLELSKSLPDNEPDFNQYFLNEIEPKLPQDKAVFVTGYPAFLSPLAIPGKRFELYINGIEIANGCEENRDPDSIRQAFETEKQNRINNHLPSHPYSEDFIKNSSLLPACSGIGLGLDRLLGIINL